MGRQKYNTESWVEEAKKVHGDKYDYSKVNYVNARTKVCIVCPKHGEFWQTPKNHMKGQGCPECGKNIAREYHKHNYQPFLQSAKEKYGDTFSFPNIENTYVNNKTYVYIKCNKCGYEFTKRPNDFLNDKVFKGCKNCRKLEAEEIRRKKKEDKVKQQKPKKGKQPTVTKEEYLRRFENKFGDTLIPYMDEYVDTQTPIHFKCNVCGYVFPRQPNNCLASKGCPRCYYPHNQKMTTEEFIEKARRVHGDKYDYSKSEYVTTDVDVCVICHERDKFGDEHGVFWVTPHAHTGKMKSGCPKCSGKFRKDTEYFIKEAKLVHGDKYDYSKVKYVRALDDVEIICKEHGSFWLTPNEHLNGRGCPYCKESHLENEIWLFLKNNELEHIREKGFDWLRTDDTHKKMFLDFFLPKYKIGIECQGVQHFNSDRFWNNSVDKEEKVLRIKERDALKKKLCEKHGIKILYYSDLGIEYPYEVFEDKDKLLQEILNNEDLTKICEE